MIKKQYFVLLIVAALYLDAVAAQQKFRIANIQPVTGKFKSIVVPMVNAMHLWEKNTNARGGFLINGQNYTVEVVDIDVGSTIDAEFNNKTKNETQNVVNGVYGQIHAVFAPYSSDLTPVAALITEAAGLPTIAGKPVWHIYIYFGCFNLILYRCRWSGIRKHFHLWFEEACSLHCHDR